MRATQFLTEAVERSIIQEAQMSAQDIANVFKQTEKTMSDSGANRTAIGMGKDVASAVNNAINKVGKWLQNTKPVQDFDNKFIKLKADIATKNPKIANALTKLGAYAKANPGKTAAVIGILTTIAAVAGGPAGGAIAGQILRGSVELLKGEKLSTAVGKGAKTAAIGYGLGKLADWTKEIITTAGGDRIVQFTFGNHGQVNFDDAGKITGPIVTNSGTVINPGDPAYAEVSKRAMALFKQSQIDSAKSAADFSNFMGDSVVLTTAQVNQLFEHIQNEGIGDWVKGKWDAAKGAVANKVATVGKNITTKVTADKLYKAWVKAGQPDDSGQVIQVLKQLGVKDEHIKSAFDSLGFGSQYQDGLNNIQQGWSDAEQQFKHAGDLPYTLGKVDDNELQKMIKIAKAPGAPEDYKQMVAGLLAKRKEQQAIQAKKDLAKNVKQGVQTA